MTTDDIRQAADLFRQVFEATHGQDGFVSLEVTPRLADDTGVTIAEVRRLFALVDRPNVFIEVPATPAGTPAIEQLISNGIYVNITLLFATAQYQAVAKAYLTGLERLQRAGGDLTRVASVASFFVSRVDTLVDKRLQAMNVRNLQGKIAIANAKLACARFLALTDSVRWRAIAALGARPQRSLRASTGTKNPAYSDTLYVDNPIGADTVNTMPLATVRTFVDHGSVLLRLTVGLDEAQ